MVREPVDPTAGLDTVRKRKWDVAKLQGIEQAFSHSP
jgi:hypothetical protein